MKGKAAASLVFLKLGGSLLSDKRNPRSFRRKTVARIAAEIRRAFTESPGMRLLLAHGGGGAAHHPARKYRTREGLPGGGGWKGFAETRRGVIEMNRRVLDAFAGAGLRPVLVPPVGGVIARDGLIREWPHKILVHLLGAGQIPLIHGDVVADRKRGFTIVSTEDLFVFLADRLRPSLVILACDVEGVYSGVPLGREKARFIDAISPSNIAEIRRAFREPDGRNGRSGGFDVTGGMAAKVDRLIALVRRHPDIETRIVSGLKPGVVRAALLGKSAGTAIVGSKAARRGRMT